jgi:hypothetical protein
MILEISIASFIFVLLIIGTSLLLKNNNKDKLLEKENENQYLFAKDIFTRDPSSFIDKDDDGIDDIIDKDIK